MLNAENYDRYPDFRRNVLEPAKNEINKFTDIKIEWEEIKEGRKVVRINFYMLNKKKEDLAKRISIIEETQPDFVLCIHQNIFTDSKYSGAQVFYYKESEEGARLAGLIQNQLIQGVDPDNTRVPKSNMNYYMLKQSPVPIVIVECGFLSNAYEEAKLGTQAYQRDLAWNIYLGTMQYLNGQ